MRSSFFLAGLVLSLVLPPVAIAQSGDASSAYARRDIAALTAMAEQGDSVAQLNLGYM